MSSRTRNNVKRGDGGWNFCESKDNKNKNKFPCPYTPVPCQLQIEARSDVSYTPSLLFIGIKYLFPLIWEDMDESFYPIELMIGWRSIPIPHYTGKKHEYTISHKIYIGIGMILGLSIPE